MVALLKSIEKWASVSPERERLLIILICAALGLFVLVTIVVAALVMTSTGSPPATP